MWPTRGCLKVRSHCALASSARAEHQTAAPADQHGPAALVREPGLRVRGAVALGAPVLGAVAQAQEAPLQAGLRRRAAVVGVGRHGFTALGQPVAGHLVALRCQDMGALPATDVASPAARTATVEGLERTTELGHDLPDCRKGPASGQSLAALLACCQSTRQLLYFDLRVFIYIYATQHITVWITWSRLARGYFSSHDTGSFFFAEWN